MPTEQYINDSLNMLKDTLNRFEKDILNDNDKVILELLNNIIVVEKETATPEVVFMQLKESYFQSDLVTANFIQNMYGHDAKTLETYLDICLEQASENALDIEDFNEKVSSIRDLLKKISPDILEQFDKKVVQYDGFKL